MHTEKNTQLKPHEEAFCTEYVRTGSVKQAMLHAGYSAESARKQSIQLLQFPHIASRIQELQRAVSQAATVNLVEVALQLKKIAFANATDAYRTWKDLKDIDALPDEVKAGIAEIRHNHKMINGELVDDIKIKMHSKPAALSALARMLAPAGPRPAAEREPTPVADPIPHVILVDPYAKPNSGQQ